MMVWVVYPIDEARNGNGKARMFRNWYDAAEHRHELQKLGGDGVIEYEPEPDIGEDYYGRNE